MSWPWPGDDRLDRRTRVAHMYRDRLADIDAAACAELDEAMNAFGQYWIIDGTPVDPETLCTVEELAAFSDVSENTVRSWVSRWPLRAQKIRARDGRMLYRWGDIAAHQKGKAG